jgi:hypothetical protein
MGLATAAILVLLSGLSSEMFFEHGHIASISDIDRKVKTACDIATSSPTAVASATSVVRPSTVGVALSSGV